MTKTYRYNDHGDRSGVGKKGAVVPKTEHAYCIAHGYADEVETEEGSINVGAMASPDKVKTTRAATVPRTPKVVKGTP